MLIGIPHNTRQKDETRSDDDSDYELIRLTKDDYDEMIEAGMNCLRVDKEQADWISRRDVFYWGMGGEQINYPECLYRSNYLGPILLLDEPAVCTRDHVIRPRLRKDREPRVLEEGGQTKVEMRFTIRQPGRYRLRAAMVDMAGRTTVVWKNIAVLD